MENELSTEFCSYEQALALKELGYGDHYGDDYFAWYSSNKDFHYRNMNSPVYPNNQSFIAPLKQQVFRWFREKYNIHGFIIHYSRVMFRWCIDSGDDFEESIKLDTYEEAENACIDKLIEIVKQQDNGHN